MIRLTSHIVLLLPLLSLTALAQGPAEGPDAAVLRRLLERHRPVANMTFEFAAIGDQQYGATGEAKWPALQSAINQSGLPFVLHIGDIKSGDTLCDDRMFADRLRAFNNFEMPFIMTPGDNEWTDCHRDNNGAFDPLERLAHLRRTFYPDNQSLGRRKMTLSLQSEDARYRNYVENQMWSMGDTLFFTVHVVGSNNNLGRNAENDREYNERANANFNWVKTAFSVARDNGFARIVLGMQANPGWNGSPARPAAAGTGFRDFLTLLEDETIIFARPVLVIMGDSHLFRIDQPMLSTRTGNQLENLFRLEVPGSGQAHWNRVRIDPSRPTFGIEFLPVTANLLPHQRP